MAQARGPQLRDLPGCFPDVCVPASVGMRGGECAEAVSGVCVAGGVIQEHVP